MTDTIQIAIGWPSISNTPSRTCQETADAAVLPDHHQATGCTHAEGHDGPHIGTVFWYGTAPWDWDSPGLQEKP